MLLDTITNIEIQDKSITIELVGLVGFEINSEDLGNKINEAKSNGIENIKIILESPGGNMAQGLAIYSILKNSGLKIESYLRGANASASTLIASSANVEDIHMDVTGLYLIHKPMSEAQGNENDFEQTKNSLKKWENSLRKIYQNLGVANETLDDLLSRNNGHGEWLNFEEAQSLGFVGKAWETEPVYNYNNQEIFKINNLLTPKKNNMEENKVVEEKTILEKIKNLVTSEKKEEVANEVEEQLAQVFERLDSLEAEVATLKAEHAEMMNGMYKEEEEEEENKVEKEEEEVTNEVSELEALKAEFENFKNEVAKKEAVVKPKEVTNVVSANAPTWKKLLTAHKSALK